MIENGWKLVLPSKEKVMGIDAHFIGYVYAGSILNDIIKQKSFRTLKRRL